MHFYALETFPRGDAETRFEQEEGHNQGGASVCPGCGGFTSLLSWLPPYRVVLTLHGKQFGDLAFGSGDDFVVSRRFYDIYRRHGLTGFCSFSPVEVIRVKSRQRKRREPPPYFRVDVQYGQTALDLAASGFEWIEPPTCPVCRTGTIMRWKRLVVEEGTWTGEDAFRPRGMSAEIMVSQRFKDVCEQEGITNAIFTPAESSGHDFYPGLKDPSELDLPSP